MSAPEVGPAVAMVLLNNSGVGGAERRFAQVYEGLRRRKVAIVLVINESLQERLLQAGLLTRDSQPGLVVKDRMTRVAGEAGLAGSAPSVAFGLRKVDYLTACFPVARWMLRRRPDAMHLILGGAYVVLPLQWLGVAPPAVLSIVGPSLREMVRSRLGLALYRAALRRARIVDTLSEAIRAALVTEEHVPPERIRVSAGSCVDTARFRPASARRPWVVFGGRLIPEKNPALFVEACALVRNRLRERGRDARFFVLGEGPLRGEVMALVRRHGLEACTEVGWREHIESILGEALVYVSVQRTDNYPSQALLEAMACGAAVVATDVGLTRKLVDETVGLLVAAEPAALADAVGRLLEHPDQAAAMGRRGRERVVLHHSMESYLDYLEGIYRSLRAE